jgi:hypothetical protein
MMLQQTQSSRVCVQRNVATPVHLGRGLPLRRPTATPLVVRAQAVRADGCVDGL